MALLIPHYSSLTVQKVTFKIPTKNMPSIPLLRLAPEKFPSFSSNSSQNTKPKTSVSSLCQGKDFILDFEDDDGEFYLDSPWEGSVVYKRDATVAHVEFSTTLERLGLGELSTGVSRARASAMGIRLPSRRVKEADDCTPVLVSVDVTRRKRRLKLDGIVRTVLTLACNRCAEPAAKCIFSNFSLLLTEDPVKDPDDEINMGVIFGEDKHISSTTRRTEEEEDDEKEIDPDDRLYFPSEEKEIDISKHIRDIVHLEITIDEVCDLSCKGLCLKCGTNLNKNKCSCGREEVQDGEYGPLKSLRKQMQQR